MSQADLQRIEHDLATIRSAVGTELTITGDHLREMIVVGVFGAYLVIAALAGWTSPIERLLAIAPFMAFAIWSQRRMWKRFRDQRAEFPRRWRWHRAEAVISVVATIAALGFLLFMRRFVLSQSADARKFVWTTLAFFFGLAMLILATVDRDRRWALPFGAALIAIGLAGPFCRTGAQGEVVIGLGTMLGASISAILLRRHLRQVP